MLVHVDLDVGIFLENCSLGGNNRSHAGTGSQATAGGRLPSLTLASQGTASQAITKSFSKSGLSAQEAKKHNKHVNLRDKSRAAWKKDVRSKDGVKSKRKNRASSSSAVRKPNAVVKAHHNIVPRFPKPMQVRCMQQRMPVESNFKSENSINCSVLVSRCSRDCFSPFVNRA